MEFKLRRNDKNMQEGHALSIRDLHNWFSINKYSIRRY